MMFCYQCQETAKGTGCTVSGVCGKKPETSRWMDLLLSVTRGVGTIYHALLQQGQSDDTTVDDFIVDALFATITNANFDDCALLQRLWLVSPIPTLLPTVCCSCFSPPVNTVLT